MSLARRNFSKIAYLGPPGTFSEEALLSDPELADSEPVAVGTIGEAIALASSRAVDAALVPIENSIEGAVSATLDELIVSKDLFIQREIVLEVHLDLMALSGVELAAIQRVASFPHATAQCRAYLAKHLPNAVISATNSTADAARVIAEDRLDEVAAVAPSIAARIYGLEVLAHAIEDHPGNMTRFVLVAPDAVSAPTGHDRTTIVCFQHADKPGSLHQILGQFAARSLNLTRLESRPTKQALGDYCFVIDVDGHVDDDVLGDCLLELAMELEGVKFLGSYPVSSSTSDKVREEISVRRQKASEWLATLRARTVET